MEGPITVRSSKTKVASLIAGFQSTDPRLAEILSSISEDLGFVFDQLNPVTRTFTIVAAPAPKTAPVSTFTYILTLLGIRLSWTVADTNIRTYEVRRGTDWDTALFVVRTTSTTVDIDPLATGSYTFLIKTINQDGVYSDTAVSLTVDIPPISNLVLSATVIDNNVLLTWTVPTSPFAILRYDVYRNGVLYGHLNGTFISIFETVSGTYTYSVIAIDSIGNQSAPATATTFVNQPPDFALQDQRVSTFSGTKTNCILINGVLVTSFDTAQTFQAHFTSHGWANPSDQVAAGYDPFIEPSIAGGTYVEIIDYGGILSNLIFTASWTLVTIDGAVSVSCSLESSTDGAIWTAPAAGASTYFASARYVRITLTFTDIDGSAPANDSLAELSGLTFVLNVKREVDGGSVAALLTDATGTQVLFNKAFKDIESITLDPLSTLQLTAIYDFVDIPNPTGFKVYVYDSAGIRVSATVSWKARGIV